MSALPPLGPLHAFAEAGRRGSFQDAARALGLTPSAVSHRVRVLERWAGQALFVRAPRSIALTAAGRRLLRAAEAAFTRLERAGETLKAGHNRLRVSALPLFVQSWLIPRLGRFAARHPSIDLSIEATNRVADFERDGVDVAIRNAMSAPSGVVARKLVDVRGVALCAPSVAARLGAIDDLARETLINISARPGGWTRWLSAAGRTDLKPAGHLTFDTIPAALEAASRGQGVALGLDPIGRPAADALGLVTPAGWPAVAESAYYVVCRKGDQSRPAVKAFIDWTVAEMAAFKRARAA